MTIMFILTRICHQTRASLEKDIKQLQLRLQQEKSMPNMLERAMGRASSTLSPGRRHFSVQVFDQQVWNSCELKKQVPWTVEVMWLHWPAAYELQKPLLVDQLELLEHTKTLHGYTSKLQQGGMFPLLMHQSPPFLYLLSTIPMPN